MRGEVVTVAELIEKLQAYDPSLPVVIPSQMSDLDYQDAGTTTVQSVQWTIEDEDLEDGQDTTEDRMCVVIEP